MKWRKQRAPLAAVDDPRRAVDEPGRIGMPEITQDHLGTARSVRVRYGTLDLGLADAVNVAFAADYDTDAIVTLTRRGSPAVRPLGRHKGFRVLRVLRVLPDDLPRRHGIRLWPSARTERRNDLSIKTSPRPAGLGLQ